MTTWAPKHRLLTWGRVLHAIEGAALVVLASRRGYSAVAWSVLGACAIGGVWEVSTHWLAPMMGWSHRSGSLGDLLAWIGGAAVAAVLWRAWHDDGAGGME